MRMRHDFGPRGEIICIALSDAPGIAPGTTISLVRFAAGIDLWVVEPANGIELTEHPLPLRKAIAAALCSTVAYATIGPRCVDANGSEVEVQPCTP